MINENINIENFANDNCLNYINGDPYPHIVIDNFFDEKFLIDIFDEFVLNNKNTQSTSKKDTKTELNVFEEDVNKINTITSDKLYSAGSYAARAEILFNDSRKMRHDLKKRNLYIDAAIKEIDNAISLEPSNWSLYLMRAECLERRAQISSLPTKAT